MRADRCAVGTAALGPCDGGASRSLELFESLGISEQFLDVGTPQRGAKIHSSGEVLGAFDLTTSGSSYPYSLGVSEEVTESILTDYLETQGGEVARSSRLIRLTARADGVAAEIDRDGERIQMDASWVVGCDGLHSPTREASGIGFHGHDLAAPWAVFDATLDGWTEVFDLTFVYLEAVPVILTALPGRRWRAYLRPSSPTSDLVADATSTIRRYFPSVSFVDVENPTVSSVTPSSRPRTAPGRSSSPATPHTCARPPRATA